MNSVFVDSNLCDDTRRQQLYDGQLFVYSPRPSTQALCALARQMCEDAFAPYAPQEAQYHMPVERYVEILADLKPRFIHHPESKIRIRQILEDFDCDMDNTYFDVPRLRTVTAGGYLTSGLGYAFKPHRDTWYSPPMCQLNWWLPVYDIEPENTMAFHPGYWDRPVKNDSHTFNYQQWNNGGRKAAGNQVTKDTRKQSQALEPLELDPQIRLVCEPGGLIIFSAAHLHSTVPNTSKTTRFSIDFRTVHRNEITQRTGAPNLDSASTGTTMMDYLRGTDLAHFEPEMIDLYKHLSVNGVS